ncbi:hypothetical protein SDC9_150426 [bioreactor metagenome]|uniref:Uncharacterized protein n=1 Tax=bioreactor metagenome TaxID=1076179 RepID=A0A645EPB8_9ZZZZ
MVGDLFLHRVGKRLKDAGGIADKVDVGLYRLVYLRRVEVDMDYLRVGGEALAVSRRTVAEARADGYDDVRAHQRAVRDRMTVHSSHAERKPARVRLRKGALAEQRRRDGDLIFEREIYEQLGGPGTDHSAAGEDHRAFGVLYERYRRFKLRHVVEVFRMITQEVKLGRIFIIPHALLDIGRHVDQNGAGTPRRGDVKGLVYRRLYLVGGTHLETVFDKRETRADNIRLLKGVRADHRRSHLSGDRHHRRRVKVCRGDSRYKIRGAGARGCNADSRPAARAGVAVRRVRSRLFVAHQYVV